MRANIRTYSATALAAVACAFLGACGGGDKTGDRAGNAGGGTAIDTSAGTVTNTDTGAGAAGTREMSDANIFALVHAANSSEIAAGQIARKQAQGAQVKAFARRMVDEHTAMDKEGRSLAKRLNVTPALPDSSFVQKDNEGLVDLRGKSGTDFDGAYIKQQIEAHENTLNLINDALKSAQSAELRQLLEKARPKVEAHLQAARQLEEGTKA